MVEKGERIRLHKPPVGIGAPSNVLSRLNNSNRTATV